MKPEFLECLEGASHEIFILAFVVSAKPKLINRYANNDLDASQQNDWLQQNEACEDARTRRTVKSTCGGADSTKHVSKHVCVPRVGPATLASTQHLKSLFTDCVSSTKNVKNIALRGSQRGKAAGTKLEENLL